MIITLLIICTAAGVAATWASRDVSIMAPLVLAGVIWMSGVLMINKGIKAMSAPVDEPSGLISLGMITILTGLAMSTSLALGRLLRGRVSTLMAGLIGGGLTLICMVFFYVMAVGI
jgi:hypothetical protein